MQNVKANFMSTVGYSRIAQTLVATQKRDVSRFFRPAQSSTQAQHSWSIPSATDRIIMWAGHLPSVYIRRNQDGKHRPKACRSLGEPRKRSFLRSSSQGSFTSLRTKLSQASLSAVMAKSAAP